MLPSSSKFLEKFTWGAQNLFTLIVYSNAYLDSSIAILGGADIIRGDTVPWNTLLHLVMGCVKLEDWWWLMLDRFLACPGANSILKTTKTRMTDRTNLRATPLATSGWSLICLIKVFNKVSNMSELFLTRRQWVNLSKRAVPDWLDKKAWSS